MRVVYAQAQMQGPMAWDESDKEIAQLAANADGGANVQAAVGTM